MKPIYLEFCGVNSFSEKAQIDFRSLLLGGLFGVFGDTGSGKSTILDCIHLALYGKMERSSGSEYIHHSAESAYVIFDFEITVDGKTSLYRVQRERRRKNNTAKAFLYEYGADGKLFALAEGTRDVDEKIEEIIGLTFADFKMCIALPQGDFAALVQAAPSDRVKLISRLFDLEKYGERLFKAVGDKYYKAQEECNLVRAKMGENEGCDEETIAAKQAEILEIKEKLTVAETELAQAEKTLLALEELQKEKQEFDALEEKLQGYVSRLEEMENRKKALEKIPFAKAVESAARALEDNRKETLAAKDKAEKAFLSMQSETDRLRVAKEKLVSENYEEKILQCSVNLEKVQAAEKDIEEEQNAKKKYDASVDAYNALKSNCIADDFDGKIAVLQAELDGLGEDENLLDYLKHNYAQVFAQTAYGEFRADLRDLAAKHPSADTDIRLLIQKYTPSIADESNLDVAQMNVAFKELTQKKKGLQSKIEQMKTAKTAFEKAQIEMQSIATQGKIYHEQWNTAKEKVAAVKELGNKDSLNRQLTLLKRAKAQAEQEVETALERINTFRVEHETQKGLAENGEKAATTFGQRLNDSLRESGFSSVAEAKALLVKIGDAEREKETCGRFFDGYALVKGKVEETDKTKFAAFDEAALLQARAAKTEKKLGRDTLSQSLADCNAQYALLLERRNKYIELEAELKQKEKYKNLCEELHKSLKANKFLEFIASEYLQEICLRASKILLSLTAGRYFLRYDKEFKVGDNLEGGILRAAKTLSGGETFLVSLSLALSLSGEICLRSRRSMEFFFLDEGFGTLDGKLVDTVMDVLTKLSKEFAVGLISHVEELKHRIENKILVTGANEHHGSQVKIENF